MPQWDIVADNLRPVCAKVEGSVQADRLTGLCPLEMSRGWGHVEIGGEIRDRGQPSRGACRRQAAREGWLTRQMNPPKKEQCELW